MIEAKTDMANSKQQAKTVSKRTELAWEGKSTQVERIPLPFQVVETMNQPSLPVGTNTSPR